MKRGLTAFILLTVLLAVGTAGYCFLMGWNVLDALYMTVITISTVGFREVGELGGAGRLFTMFLIFSGVGVIAYASSGFIRFIIEGEVRQALGRNKLEKKINRMSGHTIVCGFGRTGQIICRSLAAHGHPFVVVERDSDRIEKVVEAGWLYVRGDATHDDVLRSAGLDRAGKLVAALGSDPDNLYLVLTARQARGDLFIIARALDEESERKIEVAGADKVINPSTVGGTKIAQTILKPTVVELIELGMAHQPDMELQLHEFPVSSDSGLVGKNLRDSGLRQKYGIMIIAIKREGRPMIFNPPSDCVIEGGDILVVMGRRDDLNALESVIRV